MSNFFKNKYRVIGILLCLMLIVTLGAVNISQKILKKDSSPKTEETSQEQSQAVDEPETEDEDILLEEEPQQDNIAYNIPGNMKGVFLTPGVDFLKSPDDDMQTIKSQIDKAIDDAKSYTLNTVIVNTNYNEGVIYSSSNADTYETGFDTLEYIVSQSRESDFYVYGVFDVSNYSHTNATTPMAMGKGSVNKLLTNISEFSEKYKFDGIILDGYQNEKNSDSYVAYSQLGGGMGFNNFMRQTPEAVIKTAVSGVKATSPSTQVGILADPVWANVKDNEEGSQTLAKYTSLGVGNADTRAFIEDGLVEFVCVNAYGSTNDSEIPFGKVVEWWADLVEHTDTSLYVVQSSKNAAAQTAGWAGGDELVKQVSLIDDTPSIRGNVFDSLAGLLADPSGSTTKLMKVYQDEVEPEYILTQLEMTKPVETTFTTTETQVIFTGASDPSEAVYINDTKIPTDQSGYFTITYELKGGLNEFSVTHKEKTIDYKITRQVNILTEIAPTGNITTDGGMKIRISAVAYSDSQVTASIAGSTITLTKDENVVDEENRDSTYVTYSGEYTAPAATASVQNLGAIVVTAKWQSESKSLTGGSVSVNKKAVIEDGVPVVVTVNQAKTYPGNTLDNIPRSDCYPLPMGAMDYAVGEEIQYKGVSYQMLASGLRVKSSDISACDDYASGNTIKSISVDSKSGYTYVTLESSQKVSYNFGYNGSSVTIKFNNTNSVPEDIHLSKNPLFSSATWNGSTLTLSLLKQDGFIGYKGYYGDSGNLVFQFKNTPGSLGGARIVIDPGHGGKDVGALGFLNEYPEKVLNAAIARKVAAELEGRGATVLLLDTSGGMDLATRVAKAESFGAHFYLSIHNNTAPNASAKGTEVYYFYPYSRNLASATCSNVSSQLNTTNRGAKQSYYHVTLSSEFASVLVECGFMSNKDEYEKLISTQYTDRIAVGIADGISSALYAANTGVSNSGSENSGGQIDIEEENKPDEQNSIKLNRSTISIREGSTAKLNATTVPTDAKVSWQSSDTSIAEVDSDGRIKAIKVGTTKITATSNGETAVCDVTVVKSDQSTDNDAPVEEIYISTEDLTLEVGKTHQLDVEVYPLDASNTTVKWESSNNAVATVSSKGLVSGVKSGTATITVSSTSEGLTAKCYVVVGGGGSDGDSIKNAEYITINDVQTNMYVNSQQTLKVVTDKNKTLNNNSLIWESNNTSLATVDRNGVVKAKRTEGTVTIYVRDKEDNLYDSVRINITKEKVLVTDIKLDYERLELEIGTSETVKMKLTPSNATHTDVNWRIINTSVATVDNSGKVTAVKPGNTTLVVRTANGSVQETCRVEVVNKVEVQAVYLDIEEMEMTVGDTDYLMAEIEPPSIPNKKVTWKSSRPTIVEVDAEGNIYAKSPGTATITATSQADPTAYESCTITVVAN